MSENRGRVREELYGYTRIAVDEMGEMCMFV